MIFAPIPGWLVIVILLGVLVFFVAKFILIAIMVVIAFVKVVFMGDNKIDPEKRHSKYYPEENGK